MPRPDLTNLDAAIAYGAALRRGLVTDDSQPALVAAMRARGLARVALAARRDALFAVETRCIVSHLGRAFLDDVLAP